MSKTNPLPDLTGKTAIITGASRGIGAATARLFAHLGARVALLARSEGAIDALATELNNTAGGIVAIALPCDVADYEAVEACVAETAATFSAIDILVNNAAIIEPIARIADSNPRRWAEVQAINVNGVYHGMRAVLPSMEARGTGTIINISSGAATGALEGWSQYCSSKAAVLSLTKCGHKEAGEKGVRIVGLSPGTVATEMQVQIKQSGVNPVSKLEWSDHITPENAARGIAYLCGPKGQAHAGGDFSLRTDEGKLAAGVA